MFDIKAINEFYDRRYGPGPLWAKQARLLARMYPNDPLVQKLVKEMLSSLDGPDDEPER